MKSEYKIKKKQNIYNGFFRLHELNFIHKKHNGNWSHEVKREVFSGSQVSTVIPYDPIKKRIILLKQFRVGAIKKNHNPMMIEIVAGLIDDGETALEAAKRECKEETGCEVKKIKKIYSYYPSPGSSESYFHLFLAEIDSFEGEKILGEENEDILVKSYSIEEVKLMLHKKEIINGVTILALQWFFLEYY